MNTEQRKRSAPLFRKSFSVTKPVLKARLYVCGLGYHESWLNGEKLGDEVLQPAQTDYTVRNFYVSHDVTSQLVKGQNMLGFWLGDGFYNQDKVWGPKGISYGEPRIIAQLEITFKDGSKSILQTDETWQCAVSPVLESNVYAGENYDARLYNAKWATNQSTSENWHPVIILPSPGGELIAQQLPPCRRFGTVAAKKVDELRPGTWIFDFGQNLVGWARLRVQASPGTVLTIRFAENKLSGGELGFASGGIKATKVIQTDVYTCKGGGEEIWEPRFSYHGFRFAEVSVSGGTLRNGAPTKDFLEGIVVHTDMEVTGDFSCSDETLNRAFDWAHWTQIGNVQGVPTDCPIRERCGWTGDAHNVVPYTMYRFDAASMWNKYLKDMVTTAQNTGIMLCFGKNFGERTKQMKAVGIPTMIAPGKRFIGEGAPDWGSAIAFIPWDVYLRTGDIRPLETHYGSIRQWAEHLHKLSTNGIVYSGMGDWCKPILEDLNGRTDRELFGNVSPMLSTACYYRSVRITADVARLIGNAKDFEHFDALASEIRKAFTRAFYSENPEMVPDQTINAIAINWNVLAPELHQEVAKALAKQVQDAGYHFRTGVFGMPSLWPTLCKFGFQETAWKALQVESAPSLKYLAKRGATTFWEVWPLEKDENVEYTRSMSHPFQGGFVAWFFEGLAGITPDKDNPGFRVFHLEPQLIDGLNWVKCRFKSPMGTIESSWERAESRLIWTVEIPPGATAQIRIPGKLLDITRDSKDLNLKAVPGDDSQEKAERLMLSSGKYQIKVKLM
jgi:alpha-L-rhamnosidase